SDVLEPLFARILKGNVEFASRVLLNAAGDADAARIRQSLQACGHIHAVAEYVSALAHDVADIDPDAKLDPLRRRYLCIAFGHAPLNLGRAAQRIHDAREFHQHAVAGSLYDPSAVLAYAGLKQFALMRLQLGQRALLIDAHQPAVAHNIRSQNSSKATCRAFFGHPDCWLS